MSNPEAAAPAAKATPLETVERDTGGTITHSVIWLHGLGADGHDFVPFVPELQLGEGLRFVFPHALRRPVTINNGMVMRGWYDILGFDMSRDQDQAGIRASSASIEALIEKEKCRGIPASNIFLAGFSQGGAMALYTGLRHAEPLAGIIALSCYLLLPDRLKAEAADSSLNVPIFMAHGRQDPVVPLAAGQQSAHFLREAGYQLEWHDYPIPHSVSLDEATDLGRWMRQRVAATGSGG